MAGAFVLDAMTVPPEKRSEPTMSPLPRLPVDTKGRILIVEDEYLAGIYIEETLIEAGYDVLGIIESGEEAIQKAAELHPELVLMDIRLAGEMTGIEAAVKLRPLGIRCLFASAHADPAMRSAGEEADPVGWLTKPFSSAELINVVEAGLARARQH
jgi:DNA-binding response OmpR family regulator